eukprot:TRINITY_DN3215_c0_g1_i1.p1 TRINITY_DN3215_c0_g1~~TRINITY_DN3215_c0_g1_i1.p1  ORF type:complete len:297 (+),score=77.78 TRINITY_DN3215_c0_g1_i1:187-1077(+)
MPYHPLVEQGLDLIAIPFAPVLNWAEQYHHEYTRGALLVDDGRLVIALTLAYLVFIFFGKKVMANREPFKLTAFSYVHNLFLVCLSSWMAYELIFTAFSAFSTVWCNDPPAGALGRRMARAVHVFYVSKLYEFMDTVIMVLRKKNAQISVLHVYHHATIFPYWWLIAKTYPGGDCWWTAFLNSSIHVLMYSYYFLSAMGIRVPWKSWITKGQMLQFCLFLAQSVYQLGTGCASYVCATLGKGLFVYALSLLGLFGNFYIQTYKKKAATAYLYNPLSLSPSLSQAGGLPSSTPLSTS